MKNHYIEAVRHIDQIKDPKELVQLFELILNSVEIGTIQQIADKQGKSYNGIKNSNQYKKVNINGKKLVVVGVENNNLPF